MALSVLGLWLWQRWGGASTIRVVGYLGLLAFAVFATVCAVRAARATRGRRRRSWLAMSAGLASGVLGDLVWGSRVLWVELDQTPFPSVADVAFLLFPVCVAAALLWYPATEGGHSRTRMILDGVIVAGSLFVLSWVTVLGNAYEAGGDGLLTTVVSLGYPLASVIVATVAIVILGRAPTADRLTLALITAGVILMAVADAAFAYLTAVGRYYNGHPIDIGWMGAFAVLGIAALHDGHAPPAEDRSPRTVNAAWLWLPYLPVLAAGAVVVPRLVGGLHLGPLPVAVLCVGLALVIRQFTVLIDDRRLLLRASEGALHDPLTGVANRALFVDRLDQAVQRQRRELAPLAVLFLDVDNFKTINDSFGHSTGDQLLIRIAERLTGCLRSTDTVARLGGDEFAVLVEGHVEDAVVAADRVSAAFTQPFIVEGAALAVRPSIGLTIATAEAADVTTEGLLEKADLAMYAAKRDGGGCLRSFVPDLPFPDDLERLGHADGSSVAGPSQPAPTAHEAARRAFDGRGSGETTRADGRSWLLPAPVMQRWVRWALGVLVAALIAYAASILFRDGPGRITLFDGWLYTGITLLATALVAVRAWRVAAERWAWSLIAVGMASSALGNAVYALWVPDGQSPSLADPLWLGFYPLAYAGLLLLVRARLRHTPTVMLLDAAAAGVTCAAVAAAIASGPISAATTGSPGTVIVGLAYPVGSLLLLALVGGMFAVMGWRPEPRWLLLLTGFLLYAVADAAHLFQTAEGTFVQGTWIDVLWGTQPVLAAVASWGALDRPSPRQQRGVSVLAPPLVCTGVAVAVLGFDHDAPWSWVGQVLATLSLLTIAARFTATFRQVSLLADSQHQAMTDDLTGLANRRAVATALTAASFEYVEQLGGGRVWSGPGLLLMDLDHFKQLNDALGRHAGDQVLCQVADRLSRSVGPDDLLARVGGDEFAVLMPPGIDLATARAQAARMIDALRLPMHLEAMTVSVEATIGIVMCPQHCARPEQLLRYGYATMCRAKSSPAKIAAYDVTTDTNSTDAGVLHELRSAIAGGELTCYYQPKICVRDGHLHSVEALARWNHPVRGLLLPDQFLAQAERAGLMRPLTARVLDVALQQARRWRDRGTPLTIAVNLSVTNLLDVDLVDDIDRLLHTYRLPPDTLILEITESVFLNDAKRSRSVVEALQRLGIGLSIDDYGTGWSSLAHLQEVAVNELKLDQVFVARLRSDHRSVAIVRSTVALAHSLGASLVAEGVEDADTLNALREYGCDITQGYYHSPPLPADELDRWIAMQRQGVKR